MVYGITQVSGFDCFELVLFIVEYAPYIAAVNIVGWAMFKNKAAVQYMRWCWLLSVPLAVAFLFVAIVVGSFEDAKLNGYDMSLPSVREMLESYIETGEGSVRDILESSRYPPTFGTHEIKHLVRDLLTHTFLHLDIHNEGNVPVAYNKGNDWFRATLGEQMVYTSGIYSQGNESLMEAQWNKLEYVAHALDIRRGEKVLDIGCGWGRLAKHLTETHGAEVTGITLSSEQRKFALELNEGNSAKILLQDAMKMHERDDFRPGGFDKITCLEMAEHVGIRRYTDFLRKVHTMLKDDGVLYFQVAGLRRGWQYEDLVWGLFMGEHVFPGADASCPMGWVTTQLERAGFEVQRVHNLGNHYSRTLAQWLEHWHGAKESMVAKYGIRAYRRWEVFLAWSVRIARQGSSTVFMITATKQGGTDRTTRAKQEATRIHAQAHLAPRVAAVTSM